MAERLSSEEARTVELSKNPIRRLGQLANYAEAFRPHHAIFGRFDPITGVFTRKRLVELAEIQESAEALRARVKDFKENIEGATATLEANHLVNQAAFSQMAENERFGRISIPDPEAQPELPLQIEQLGEE